MVFVFFLLAYLKHITFRCGWFRLKNIFWRKNSILELLHEEILPTVHIFRIAKRWCDHFTHFFAISDGVDFVRVYQTPEIVLVVTAIQTNAYPRTQHTDHRSNANRCDAPWIQRLQFHADFEFIYGRIKSLLEATSWSGYSIFLLK